MPTRLVLPRLYVILDATLLTVSAIDCAQELAAAGVHLMQYRHKHAPAGEMLKISKQLASVLQPQGITFIVNDRPDVAAMAYASGVHVGQDDLGVEATRSLVGEKIIGISTHNLEQFKKAIESSADYIAVGPIFATSSKANPDPVVGTQLIRDVRRLTDKPIVAIGGIKLENAADVIAAGADSVAVISDILGAPDRANRAKQYLDLLGEAQQGMSA
ncbi:MAG: thiamine phosphate synthase [Acidobacteria bacterium]|nr:thiamine phosphate synthase [Acidobacteriota bacterium]